MQSLAGTYPKASLRSPFLLQPGLDQSPGPGQSRPLHWFCASPSSLRPSTARDGWPENGLSGVVRSGPTLELARKPRQLWCNRGPTSRVHDLFARPEIGSRAILLWRRIKSDKSAGAIRIEFRMRRCASSPFSQSLYTLALQTCRRFATSFTVSSRTEPGTGRGSVGEDVWRSSKLAAKFWLNDAKPCDLWNACDPEFSLVTGSCKGLLWVGRSAASIGVQVVAGSNPVAPTAKAPGVPPSCMGT